MTNADQILSRAQGHLMNRESRDMDAFDVLAHARYAVAMEAAEVIGL